MMKTMASGSAKLYCSHNNPTVMTNAGAPSKLLVEALRRHGRDTH